MGHPFIVLAEENSRFLRFGRDVPSLGLGAEEEVGSGDSEEDVWGPGGHDGWKGSDVAHGLEESVDGPVGDGEADGDGVSGERAAFAHGGGEGDCEHRHDEGDEWVSELAVELYAEALGVEAGLPEIVDVVGEFAVGHLLRWAVFFDEVNGLLADLGEG